MIPDVGIEGEHGQDSRDESVEVARRSVLMRERLATTANECNQKLLEPPERPNRSPG